MNPNIEDLLRQQYRLTVSGVKRLNTGAGSDAYLIETDQGKYIFKDISVNEMNNPKMEPRLSAILLDKGIPAARFIKNRESEYVTEDKGKVYHL